MSLLNTIKKDFIQTEQDLSINDYLELCKSNKLVYASPAERMLEAIGEPKIIDTKLDERLSRIYSNRVIKRYPAFSEFFGMEDTIEQIVSFFKHAAQGLEEKKQILYLLGPVGGGKSSLAERLKQLMEKSYIYVLVADGEVSPVWENPLGLFSNYRTELEEEYGIHRRYVPSCPSPWATKRLAEYEGDISKFTVRKFKCSISSQVGISKVEPGDENNQDISSLVGKVDIRKLAEYPQNDADAYSYSGSLCKSNQGLMEFVEMFKAPIKLLHPSFTIEEEGNFNGTENLPAIPFQGILLAHLTLTVSKEDVLEKHKITFQIKNDKGEELGDCTGDICDGKQQVFSKKHFEPGTYTFTLEHVFKYPYFPNIIRIGIDLNRVK